VVVPARESRNWYGYCGNNPVNSQDPTGLSTTLDDFGYSIVTNSTTQEEKKKGIEIENTAAGGNQGSSGSSGGSTPLGPSPSVGQILLDKIIRLSLMGKPYVKYLDDPKTKGYVCTDFVRDLLGFFANKYMPNPFVNESMHELNRSGLLQMGLPKGVSIFFIRDNNGKGKHTGFFL